MRVYKVLLSQSGTDAPTAVILQNTLKFIPEYGYDSEGNFFVNGNFPAGKTTAFGICSAPVVIFSTDVNTENQISIKTYKPDIHDFVNDALNNSHFEINIK